LALAALATLGVAGFIMPRFGELAPVSAYDDFTNHVALVTAAIDTWQTTGFPPISTDKIRLGIEYPYFLFGNIAFYLVAAAISLTLHAPAYIGTGIALALAFTAGLAGIFLLARSEGLPARFAIPLAFLYASGPYISINLMVRWAFPEYVAWQLLPVLLLAIRAGLNPGARHWQVLLSSIALAAPFYIHKLIAPYVMLTLVWLALALLHDKISLATLVRMTLIGSIATCWTVPAWLPLIRGLEQDTVAGLVGTERPHVMNGTFANLLWPVAQNSFPVIPINEMYEGHFALQIGLLPCVGFIAAILDLARLKRGDWLSTAKLLAVVVLFAGYVALIMDFAHVWRFVPSVLANIQFTFRLIGFAYLVGFVLFVQVFGRRFSQPSGSWASRFAQVMMWIVFGCALVSNATYWHLPAISDLPSASIQPAMLRDFSSFFKREEPLNAMAAVTSDDWLVVPPKNFALGAKGRTIVLNGFVPKSVFERTREPLVVRMYGLQNLASASEPDPPGTFAPTARQQNETISPITEVLHPGVLDTEAQVQDQTSLGMIRIWGFRWAVRLLASATVNRPGPIELRAAPMADVTDIAFECSRGAAPLDGAPRDAARRFQCLKVDFVGDPNQTDYGRPKEIEEARRVRQAFGTVEVDASGLPDGYYILPTFDYRFLGVEADGAPTETFPYGPRPLVKHTADTDSYTLRYHLEPEIFAFLFGVILFGGSVAVGKWRDASHKPKAAALAS
jgi:hypothetical protein